MVSHELNAVRLSCHHGDDPDDTQLIRSNGERQPTNSGRRTFAFGRGPDAILLTCDVPLKLEEAPNVVVGGLPYQYWQWMFAVYGRENRVCRNIRLVCLWNGSLLTVAGMVAATMALNQASPPAHPSLAERAAHAAIPLLIRSGGGLLAIYQGRYKG